MVGKVREGIYFSGYAATRLRSEFLKERDILKTHCAAVQPRSQ
jgi:hypothetical protein